LLAGGGTAQLPVAGETVWTPPELRLTRV